MNSILKKILNRFRVSFFPTTQELEVKKWISDGGDEKYRYDFNLTPDSIVFDLGGYKGQWASDIYSRYNCNILIFEPAIVFADNIKKRFEINQKIQVFSIALGSFGREESISMGEDGSSVFGKYGKKETIQFKDVSTFFEFNAINRVDLMKINIEGGEYELLSRLIETGLIKKIKQIQVQFHNISDDSINQMNNIKEKLKQTHRSTFEYQFVWENWEIINQ
jgi:FkbM family methyltransferase